MRRLFALASMRFLLGVAIFGAFSVQAQLGSLFPAIAISAYLGHLFLNIAADRGVGRNGADPIVRRVVTRASHSVFYTFVLAALLYGKFVSPLLVCLFVAIEISSPYVKVFALLHDPDAHPGQEWPNDWKYRACNVLVGLMLLLSVLILTGRTGALPSATDPLALILGLQVLLAGALVLAFVAELQRFRTTFGLTAAAARVSRNGDS